MAVAGSREKLIGVFDLSRVCDDLEVFPEGEAPKYIKDFNRRTRFFNGDDLQAGMRLLNIMMVNEGLDGSKTGLEGQYRSRFREKYGASYTSVKDWEIALGGRRVDLSMVDYPRTRRDYVLDLLYAYSEQEPDGKGLVLDTEGSSRLISPLAF